MVRRWVAGAAASAVLLAASACTEADPAPTGSSSSSPSTPTSQTSPVTDPLRLHVHGVPEAVDAYREVARDFAARSGVEVEVEVETDGERAAESVRADLRSSGPAPDVFLLDQGFLPEMMETERLQHVDEELESRGLQFGDGYQRVALTAFSAQDQLQCMPVDMSPRVMYVNPVHVRWRDLQARGVVGPEEDGWQWQDFARAMRLVARDHRDVEDFATIHLPVDLELLTAFVRSAGGDVVDDVDEPTALTLEDSREVLTAYLRLARVPGLALTEQQAREVPPLERFADGGLGVLFGTRADVPALRDSGIRYEVLTLPSFGTPRSVADIAGLCVDRDSDQLDQALDLVAYAAGNEGSTTLARSDAVVPANLDVAFSPAFGQGEGQAQSRLEFTEALTRSGYMPFSAAWDELAAEVETSLRGVLTLRGGVDRVLERLLPVLDERLGPRLRPPIEQEG